MSSDLLFILGLVLLVAPGIGCWTLIFPEDSALQGIAWGSVLGVAAAVYLAYLCSLGHLSWFFLVWIVPLAFGTISFLRSRRNLKLSLRASSQSAESSTVKGSKESFNPQLALIAILLLVAVLQILIVTRHTLPDGWDPSFHLLLAKKIVLSDHIIRDWQPFENATLNYPIGSHLLMALFARWSGLPLPLLFQLLMVAFGILSALAIYALALEYFGSELVGLYAAIAYSFWTFWGSTDYFRWGGLPNQLGMLIGLEILSLIVRGSERKKSIILIALLFASLCISHHHVMVTMGIILVALIGFFLLTNDPGKRYLTLLLALGLAGIVAAPYLIPLILKAGSLTQTRVLQMHDFTNTILEMGLIVLPFAIVGVALDYLRKPSNVHTYHVVMATLLLVYFLAGPLHYFYELERTGQGFVVFSPSRFLFDLTYFLSLFAGYALFRLQEYFSLGAGVTTAFALSLGLTNLPQWKIVFTPDGERGRIAAYDWIQQHTPDNSIVMMSDPYASYLSWRRTLLTPMPVSEPHGFQRISDRAKIELLAGLSPEELRNVELVIVSRPGDRHGGKVLWTSPEGWQVSEVYERNDY